MTDFFDPERPIFSPAWGLIGPELPVEALVTLDPALPREPRLVVPVDVQALVVGPRGSDEARGDIRSRALDENPTERLPGPFTTADRLGPGVHLHWALPDGLTAAKPEDSDDDGDLNLRPLPNRWLVSRVEPGRPAGRRFRRPVRSWVVESEWGQAFPLEDWQPDGARTGRAIPLDELTAVAGGELGWAAVYDNVVGRFAFHDELEDLPTGERNGPHSYVVTGWYSRPDLDPLHPARTRQGLRETLAELAWQVSDADFDRLAEGLRKRIDDIRSTYRDAGQSVTGVAELLVDKGDRVLGTKLDLDDSVAMVPRPRPNRPRQSLYSGVVYGVAGSGQGRDRRPQAGSTVVAIGPTGTDSISRMVAGGSRAADRENHERLLAAFGHGVIEHYGSPDGLTDVDVAIHRNAFRSRDGGSTTDVVRTAATVGPDEIPDSAKGTVPVIDQLRVGQLGPGSVAFLFSDDRFATVTDHFGVPPDVRAAALTARLAQNDPPPFTSIRRPLPRFHLPVDPVLTVRGLARSLRHGYDGRFDDDERLACRVSGQFTGAYRGIVLGHQVIDMGQHGSVPPECVELVGEAALLDPDRGDDVLRAVPDGSGLAVDSVRRRIEAELRLDVRLQARSGDSGRLVSNSIRDGAPRSPVGVTYWTQPWVPLYVEWEAVARLTDRPGLQWRLAELDLEPEADPADIDAALTEVVLTGRSLLASSAVKSLSDSVDQFLDAERRLDADGDGQLDNATQSALESLGSVLRRSDLLTGTLDGLTDHLLGFDTDVAYVDEGADHAEVAPTRPPQLVRAGYLELKRVRVVDAFGRILDLDATLALTRVADPLVDPRGGDRGGRPRTRTEQAPIHLAPRLTTPARLQLRFLDAGDDGAEARIDESTPIADGNPVAGWLLPDHADDGMEFFDQRGLALGQLFHRGHRREVVWEGTPARPGPLGAGPPGGTHLGGLAEAIIRRDALERAQPDDDPNESPLGALLRAIDTTVWTTDPFGTTGSEHLSELIGRPMAVVRATLVLDLYDDSGDYGLDPAAAAERRAAFLAQADRAFPVRLGSLTRFDDGLLGYWVDDDYDRFHPVHPSVREQARLGGAHVGFLGDVDAAADYAGSLAREPITQRYIAPAADLMVRPGRPVTLTLLLLPGLGVHATCGLVPRKRLELARSWITEPLARIVPSFRFGPLLVDPATVRMPRVPALPDGQAWAHRETGTTWRDDPIVAATAAARLPDTPAVAQEGWVHARPVDEEEGSP